MNKNICVVTGSRADYGLLYWIMKEIEKKKNLNLIPIVIGQHTNPKYGFTAQKVIDDGFENIRVIGEFNSNTTPRGIDKSISHYIFKMGQLYEEEDIDLVVLLGDRYEILAAGIATVPFNIPVAHIGGGEVTEGVIDDTFRYCLTSLSKYHFTISDVCSKRIEEIVNDKNNIYNVGSPRLDYIKNIKFKDKKTLEKELDIKFGECTGLLIYHPETNNLEQIKENTDKFFDAITDRKDITYIVINPNMDTYSDYILDKIKEIKNNKNIYHIDNLNLVDYISVMNEVDFMIGNSSSGIIEAPTFKLPVINIGTRQKGRDCVGNLINVGYDKENINDAIIMATSKEYKDYCKNIKNPFGDGTASKKIVDIMCDIL